MGKIRFLLKHRVTTIFRYVFRRRRYPVRYQRLNPSSRCKAKPISTLVRLTRFIKTKAKAIYSGRKYMQIRENPVEDKPLVIPKGYTTVYVGQKEGDFHRVLVPVIFFNHPLFGELLREAEEEYGYDHPGGITLPCQISEFEYVQTRIKQGRFTRKIMTRKYERL